MEKITTSYLIVALSVVISLGSCKEDKEEIVENSIPKIEFVSHEADAQVWNTTTVKAQVTDENAVEKVEFYANGTLVKTMTAEPFEFTLDTKGYTDGKLEIKALVYNKVGKKSESVLFLDVLNTLLKFSVPEGYIQEDRDIWMFLSDDEGNVLVTEQLEDGKTSEFMRPDGFEGSAFTKNFLFVYKNFSDFTYFYIESYSDIASGFEGKFYKGVAQNAGRITLTFDDLRDNQQTWVSSGRNYPNLDLKDTCIGCDYSISVDNFPANLFVSYQAIGAVPSYIFLDDVQEDETIDLEINTFTQMISQNITVPSGYDGGEIFLGGVTDPLDDVKGWFDIYSTSFMSSATDLELYYPEGLFDRFFIAQTLYKGSKSYTQQKASEAVLLLEEPSFDFNLASKSGESIVATTEGDYDIFTASWSYVDSESFITHYIIGEQADNIDVKRPSLPNEFLDVYPVLGNVLEAELFGVYDYTHLEGYTDYIEYQFNRDAGLSTNYFERSSVEETIVKESEMGRFKRKDRFSIERLRNQE